MRTLYVVTHPEATHHVEGLVGGWYSELTPKGVADAGRVGASLREAVPLGAEAEVHTSDLLRARRTARVVADLLHVGLTPDAGLREKSYGEAEGRPQAWLDQRFVPPPRVGDRLHHDEGVAGAETRWSFATRVYAGPGQDPGARRRAPGRGDPRVRRDVPGRLLDRDAAGVAGCRQLPGVVREHVPYGVHR